MGWLDNFDLVRDIIDIALLSFIIYQAYIILEETKAIQLLKGAISILLIYLLALFLQLNAMLWILNLLAPGLMIGLAIVFQPELRNIFTRIGQQDFFTFKSRAQNIQIDTVISAAEVLSGRHRGALIVFARNVGVKNITDTGTKIDSELTSSLIITIFGHDTPLHDGAIVIQKGRISAAGCFLPLSKQNDIKKSFGTRHRAALGMVEETDAVVLVVSEESRAISLAYDSTIFYDLSVDEVEKTLKKLLGVKETIASEKKEEIN